MNTFWTVLLLICVAGAVLLSDILWGSRFGKVRVWMIYILGPLSGVALIGVFFTAFQQPPKKFIAMYDLVLTTKQEATLNKVKSHPTPVAAYPIRFDPSLCNGKPLIVQLSPYYSFTVQKYQAKWEESLQKRYLGLYWEDEKNGEFGLLTMREDRCVGLLMHKGKMYEIQSVAGPLNIIVEIDQTKFPKEKHTPVPPIQPEAETPNPPCGFYEAVK